jgi:hypothetical protein
MLEHFLHNHQIDASRIERYSFADSDHIDVGSVFDLEIDNTGIIGRSCANVENYPSGTFDQEPSKRLSNGPGSVLVGIDKAHKSFSQSGALGSVPAVRKRFDMPELSIQPAPICAGINGIMPGNRSGTKVPSMRIVRQHRHFHW